MNRSMNGWSWLTVWADHIVRSSNLCPQKCTVATMPKRWSETSKKYILAILEGEKKSFPSSLWNRILPQAELTINLLCQAMVNLKISVWEFLFGPFDFNKSPFAHMGWKSSPMPRQVQGDHGISEQNMDLCRAGSWPLQMLRTCPIWHKTKCNLRHYGIPTQKLKYTSHHASRQNHQRTLCIGRSTEDSLPLESVTQLKAIKSLQTLSASWCQQGPCQIQDNLWG